MLKFNSERQGARLSAFSSALFSDEMRSGLSLLALALALAFASTVSTGCSSFGRSVKNFVSGDEKPKVTGPKYSDNENLRFQSDRKYRRMNKSRFEDEAEVSAQAGSLWVMEGQGAYLFSQNQTRILGDLLNVKLDGSPKQQLQSKVKVISKLLDRLDAPSRGLASKEPGSSGQANTQATPAGGAKPGADATAAKNDGEGGEKQGATAGAAAAEKPDSKSDPISAIGTVPTRIVEQLKDGSYRVRGMQPFMIGRREYKVIVTGVVRAEDFDDAGIDSSKLLDPQFDIVSSRKGATL